MSYSQIPALVGPYGWGEAGSTPWFSKKRMAREHDLLSVTQFCIRPELINGGVTPVRALLESAMAIGDSLFFFEDAKDKVVDESEGLLLDITPGAAFPLGRWGNGTSKNFQLARKIGDTGFELLQFVSVDTLKVNGVPGAYSLGLTSEVTFVDAPPVGALLKWSGSFKYLCRFTSSTQSALRSLRPEPGAAPLSQDSAHLGTAAALEAWIWACPTLMFESVFD